MEVCSLDFIFFLNKGQAIWYFWWGEGLFISIGSKLEKKSDKVKLLIFCNQKSLFYKCN